MQDLHPPGERHRLGRRRRARRLRNRHGHCPTGEGREQRADLRLIKHQLSSRAECDLIYSEGNISNVVHASLRRVSAEAVSEVEGAKSRDPEFRSRPMPLQSILSKIGKQEIPFHSGKPPLLINWPALSVGQWRVRNLAIFIN